MTEVLNALDLLNDISTLFDNDYEEAGYDVMANFSITTEAIYK